MDIDPPKTTPIEAMPVDETKQLVMLCDSGLWQRRQQTEDLLAIAQSPAGQLPDDEGMTHDRPLVE